MLRDLSFALRTLRRSPVFTITAVLTLALGIGATAAIFTVADAVLLRSLPYRDPDRLVIVYSDLRTRANYAMPFSNENFIDIRNGSKGVFEDLAAVFTSRQILPKDDDDAQLRRAPAYRSWVRCVERVDVPIAGRSNRICR